MSRIGKMPVAIPAGVEVTVADGNLVTVKGPNGTLTQQLQPSMTIKQEGAELLVSRPDDGKENRALHGLTRSLLHNMVVGVTEGFKKELDVVSGCDKQKVGQFAAEIREKRPPEPYKGKGIKYADEVIRRKVGKTGAKK